MQNAPTPRPGRAQSKPRLGELLVASGVITPAQLELALREQTSWGGRIGQNLVDAGFIDERTLAAAIARQLSLPLADLDRTPPPDEVVRLVPVNVAERYGLVAVAVSEAHQKILVACSDPTSNEAMREVRRTTGLVAATCVATASQIDRVTRRAYYGETGPSLTPSPHLQVSRSAYAPVEQRVARPDREQRLDGVERRLDQLLDLVQGGRRA